MSYINKRIICKCNKKFKAVPGTHLPGGKESSPGLSCAVTVGEKRKRSECGDGYNAANRILVLNNRRRASIDNRDAREDSESGKQVHEAAIDKAVDNIRRGLNDNGDAVRREESGWGKQLYEVEINIVKTFPSVINTKQKIGRDQDAQMGAVIDNNRHGFNDGEDALNENQDDVRSSGSFEVDANSEDVIDRALVNNTRAFNDDEDAGRREELGCGRQLHEVEETLPANRMFNEDQDAVGSSGNLEVDKDSGLCDSGPGVAVKISECAGPRFNDFNKARERAHFSDCQTWALFDAADGMPRQYAVIRKVSAPSFGLRITYLEPDPDDEREILWCDEDLPVSVGKFRFGKNQNTKDRSIFSHRIRCQGCIMTGEFSVSPRKGETWALFKKWDIDWSSEPDSHRKYEYDIVEILSGKADGAGVSVAILHKAKGFASVFFRMGSGDADTIQIPSHSLYRFSHRIPSFKMKRVDMKGVPKDAYELDQAALPESMEEKIVPTHLYAEPKPEALCFPWKGKVFQTGQIWSLYSGNVSMPLYYCRIQKITLIRALEQEPELKLHVGRLKAMPFPEEVIQWEDKRMPVGCGTFLVREINGVITTDDVSHQILPQTSLEGDEYTIVPKIGDVWAIYRLWTCDKKFKDVGCFDYDIVEVLDDTMDYKVLALEAALKVNEGGAKKTVFRAAERRHPGCEDEDGPEVIFTIPKSKMLRFSHQVPASRVTKEIEGEMKELFEVDSRALPTNVRVQDR
ncbi:unnamed protein product [Microthlaspi erraticum]|uniref:DUF3444 domain-containing protein n=1 Tax=Microthlaspi erraticum TaxID=1685480 RepID=A0A6D2LAI1_9BRAS|nr:unnamed protein product [Microthlaspi erraticum]